MRNISSERFAEPYKGVTIENRRFSLGCRKWFQFILNIKALAIQGIMSISYRQKNLAINQSSIQ